MGAGGERDGEAVAGSQTELGRIPTTADQAADSLEAPTRSRYGVFAVVLAFLAFAGFAKTFYLKSLFGSPLLSGLVAGHGVVLTLWFLLFCVQVRLASTGRIRIHRLLGFAGLVLAALVATTGVLVSLGLARRELCAVPDSVEPALLLALQLFDVVGEFVLLVRSWLP